MDYTQALNGLILSQNGGITRRPCDIDALRQAVALARYYCLFGAGSWGADVARRMEEYVARPDFFCDNDAKKHGTIVLGIPVIPFERLLEYKDDAVIQIAASSYAEISAQLESHGFQKVFFIEDIPNQLVHAGYYDTHSLLTEKDRLLSVMNSLEDEASQKAFYYLAEKHFLNQNKHAYSNICTGGEYYPGIYGFGDSEVYIDCGAFDGDSVMEFLRVVNNRFSKIFAFELNARNHVRLLENMAELDVKDKIVCVNKGVYNKNMTVNYSDTAASSRPRGDGGLEGEFVRLDDYLAGEPAVTFIKIDVEGAEIEALEGMAETIRRFKPKLAVCLYHHPEHLLAIPLYIRNLVPEYKLYIRHHSRISNDTVLYAAI